MPKKNFILLILILLLSCGKNADQSEKGKVTIKVQYWYAENKDRWNEAIQEFEKVHPGIKVDAEIVVYQMYVQKLLTSSAANVSVGDLIMLEDWFAQDLLERDYLINLNDFVKNEIDTSQLFTPPFKDYINSKGELIGIPIALISSVLFYNKDLFDIAKIPYPDSTWTYDDLLNAAQKLTKDTDGNGNIDQWGIQLNYSPLLDAILYSFGGGVLTPDKSRSYFDDPNSISGLKYFIDLHRTYKVAPAPDPATMSVTVPFLTGKFAMVILPDFKTKFRGLKFNWDMTYTPLGPFGRKSPRFSQAFGIPKDSKNQNEALIFLKWLLTSLPLKYANFAEGLLPVNKKLANSDEYLNDEPKCNRKILLDIQDRFSFCYQRPGYFELRDYGFQPEVEKAISGKLTVEEAAKEGSKKIDEVLKRITKK